MSAPLERRAIGRPMVRIDGPAKVTGTAPYAFEHQVADPLYLHAVTATVARGRIVAVDTAEAEALDGVVAVLTPANAGRLASDEDQELAVLQSDGVAYRGQFVAAVLAETSEIARQAAGLVAVEYEVHRHDVELTADRADLYAPEHVNPSFETDTADGDVEAAMAAAARTVDAVYTTPTEHHNPIEPHTTVATWSSAGDRAHVTLYDSTQGPSTLQTTLAEVFGLDPSQVDVIAPYVGGAFGSKLYAHAHQVLAVLAAQKAGGRPVKFAVTRQQMFAGLGYRTPTIQRVRLGADADGRLIAIAHDVIEQTARIKEFAEQTAVGTRMMYAAENRRTSHRLAELDVSVPAVMRAPGEAPGMFALECAMDEMAIACGLDPIDFRVLNEPDADPESGLPYSTRNLVACLREGARRFAWDQRDPRPGARRDGEWLVGTGVAAATYPFYQLPGSTARILAGGDGRYRVEIGAADIGTGAWTALTQIAADALGVPVDAIDLRIGDSRLPAGSRAGGSSGINSWGPTIIEAARVFREKFGRDPGEGDEAGAEMPENPNRGRFSMHAFGAQFAEVRVHAGTGEVRVPRMLGVFAVGQVINAHTARSQLIGGMTMGLSMALHEHSIVDLRFGHVVNHDLAGYHVAVNADVKEIEATWIDEHDPRFNPMGSKGIGEIGIVGAPAAIANAVHHATGTRIRDLPITPDKLLT
jgi:xanthine dehydrogenase YagR molybdenum-binding subunit